MSPTEKRKPITVRYPDVGSPDGCTAREHAILEAHDWLKTQPSTAAASCIIGDLLCLVPSRELQRTLRKFRGGDR